MTWKMHFSIATYLLSRYFPFKWFFYTLQLLKYRPTYYCLNINHIGLEFKKLCTEVRWNRLMLVSKKILMSLTYFKGFKVPHVNNIKHSLSKGFSSLCTLVMVRKTTYSSLFMITWTHLELYKRIHPRVL